MVHRQVEEIAAFRRAKSGNTAPLRCQTCGALSQGTPDAVEAGRRPGVGAELEAILTISQALTQLQDDERQRVLHWATERFRGRAVADPVAPAIAVSDLRADDLDDLFGSPAPEQPDASGLGEDDELGDLFEGTTIALEGTTVAADAIVVAVAAPQVDQHNPPLQISEAPLDALVADFVSEFRRLAVECQGS